MFSENNGHTNVTHTRSGVATVEESAIGEIAEEMVSSLQGPDTPHA